MRGPGSGRHMDPKRREWLRSLWQQGLTTRAIVGQLGRTYEAVRLQLAAQGSPEDITGQGRV